MESNGREGNVGHRAPEGQGKQMNEDALRARSTCLAQGVGEEGEG